MNTAEWILVAFLSVALLAFLILGIILISKLISISNEAKKIIITGQGIANKTDNIVENVKDLTSIGGVVKTFTDKYVKDHKTPKSQSKGTKNGK